MPASPQWRFDRFRLDPDHACLWCEAQAMALPPKAFALLHYLVTHPDRLVTKDELLDAVWPETAVSDAVIRVAIGVLRKVLDDTAQTPRFIATVARRGYRFLAPVTVIDPPEVGRAGTPLQRTEPVSPARGPYRLRPTCCCPWRRQTPGTVPYASTPRVVRPASAWAVALRTWRSAAPVARRCPCPPHSAPAVGSAWKPCLLRSLHPSWGRLPSRRGPCPCLLRHVPLPGSVYWTLGQSGCRWCIPRWSWRKKCARPAPP